MDYHLRSAKENSGARKVQIRTRLQNKGTQERDRPKKRQNQRFERTGKQNARRVQAFYPRQPEPSAHR